LTVAVGVTVEGKELPERSREAVVIAPDRRRPARQRRSPTACGDTVHGFRHDPIIVRIRDAEPEVFGRGLDDGPVAPQGLDLIDRVLGELQLDAELAPQLAKRDLRSATTVPLS